MLTSIVYPLGNGSRLENIEIRYSLRSVEAHAKNYDRIFIIGIKPDFLKWSERLIHIPFSDDHTPFINVWLKLREIALNPQIQEHFLFMNDDFFLVQDFDCRKAGFVTSGDGLDEQYYANAPYEEITNKYHLTLRKTLEVLQSKGLTTYAFNTHQPVIFEKTKVLQVFQEFANDLWQHPLSFRCCYGNFHKIKEIKRPARVLKNNLENLYGRKTFALSNQTNYDFASKTLQALFPVKSEFEVEEDVTSIEQI